MDKPPRASFLNGGQYVSRPSNVAGDKSVAIGCVDNSCHMNHRIGVGTEFREALLIVERSRHPLNTLLFVLRAPGEGTDYVAFRHGMRHQTASDKTCGSSHCDHAFDGRIVIHVQTSAI